MYKAKCKQQANDNNPKRFKGVVDDPDFSNWPAPLKIISQTIDSIKDFQVFSNEFSAMSIVYVSNRIF